MRGYKVKIYPNKAQEQYLLKQIGACRYVYNYFLDLKSKTYLETGKSLSYAGMCRELTKLRHEIDWLGATQSTPLQQSLRNLDTSFNRFFRKKSKYPKFHKKGEKDTMKKVLDWSIEGNHINITKNIAVSFRGKFPKERQATLTITRDSSGSWWASTLGEESRIKPKLKKKVLGIDVGIETLATLSDGTKYKNINTLKKYKESIRTASKKLSRTQKGSNRRNKARTKLSRIHRKVGFIRQNYLHHISRAIVGKNHAVIAVEDLSVVNMMKNRKLSKAISDVSWGELLRQIEYKQIWNGGKFVKVGRFFPSSKTCSNCNFIISKLPLNIRSWNCPRCLVKHDRDINASIMIAKQAGERLGVETGDGSVRFA